MCRFLKFGHFSCELKETGSSGSTESEVWIGDFNVKAWKTTKHKLHKIWRSLYNFTKFQQNEHTPGELQGWGEVPIPKSGSANLLFGRIKISGSPPTTGTSGYVKLGVTDIVFAFAFLLFIKYEQTI